MLGSISNCVNGLHVILVQRQFVLVECPAFGRREQYPLGVGSTLPCSHLPTQRVCREQIKNHVEGIRHPFAGSRQPREILGPHLVGRTGHQAGRLEMWMTPLAAAFADNNAILREEVHSPDRADATSLLYQRGIPCRL